MGSPLSPILANLFMAEFEHRALESAMYKPKLWLRYVDDTLVIWPHGREKLREFLQHLNTRHPNIKFTVETEEESQLPFLDVMIIRKLDGSLGHTVYRKPSHTNRYLNASSHHHPAQLNSVVKTLIHRSQTLSDVEHRNEEMNTIQNILQANGYSQHKIYRARGMNKNQPEERERERDLHEEHSYHT